MGRQGRCTISAAIAAAGLALIPASASADGLMAAFERYESGRGFEIGMVNVGTGAAISVPASVNTPADELHPALSPDGRYLAFMRTTLQPRLNGDIVPPASRQLLMLDRNSGSVTTLRDGEGAGPVFRATGNTLRLSWGIRPEPRSSNLVNRLRTATFSGGSLATPVGLASAGTSGPAGSIEETTHAVVGGSVPFTDPGTFQSQPQVGRYTALASFDPNTGAVRRSIVQLDGTRENFQLGGFLEGSQRAIGSETDPAGHPVPRPGDNYVALHRGAGAGADIHTIAFPGESTTTVAPAPITTSDPERMPAWAPPNGNQLGFVRSANGRRQLGVFDLTPGIQNALNPPTDIGAEAPTPQTRAYQEAWGGLSLAYGPLPEVPTVTCNLTCLASLRTLSLKPRVSLTTSGQKIGILVARVTGKRKLLGRSVPRIRLVGRVPLGRTRKGLNRFRWNGRVEGRRLKPGRYLLTFRALKRDRILSISGSVQFRVKKGGKVTAIRRLR